LCLVVARYAFERQIQRLHLCTHVMGLRDYLPTYVTIQRCHPQQQEFIMLSSGSIATSNICVSLPKAQALETIQVEGKWHNTPRHAPSAEQLAVWNCRFAATWLLLVHDPCQPLSRACTNGKTQLKGCTTGDGSCWQLTAPNCWGIALCAAAAAASGANDSDEKPEGLSWKNFPKPSSNTPANQEREMGRGF
jgi:hypothetical protein